MLFGEFGDRLKVRFGSITTVADRPEADIARSY